jgi:hypothetical protein
MKNSQQIIHHFSEKQLSRMRSINITLHFYKFLKNKKPGWSYHTDKQSEFKLEHHDLFEQILQRLDENSQELSKQEKNIIDKIVNEPIDISIEPFDCETLSIKFFLSNIIYTSQIRTAYDEYDWINCSTSMGIGWNKLPYWVEDIHYQDPNDADADFEKGFNMIVYSAILENEPFFYESNLQLKLEDYWNEMKSTIAKMIRQAVCVYE